MSELRADMASPYLEWAKLHSHARFNLATSGVMNYPLSDLPVRLEDLELSGPSFYGYAPLQQRLAERCGVAPECVVATTGTSMANHLAMAACLEPGDEALIEHPTYEPLLSAARYLGAKVVRFARRPEHGFRFDLEEVRRSLSSRTRLIVMTNLHNPTSVLTDQGAMGQLGELAGSIGARVLVDEVYLEADFTGATPSAFHLDPQRFVVTSSLTKAYGLSGLRCGWILADPDLARRMWRLNDLYGVIPAHPAERLSVIALDNLGRIANRARALLEGNRALLAQFLDSRQDLLVIRPQRGTVAFPGLRRGSVERLCHLLRAKYETAVVPGRFFECPEYFRLGIGGPTELVGEGLRRLDQALDELAREVPEARPSSSGLGNTMI